jgi:hypothetical protein
MILHYPARTGPRRHCVSESDCQTSLISISSCYQYIGRIERQHLRRSVPDTALTLNGTLSSVAWIIATARAAVTQGQHL